MFPYKNNSDRKTQRSKNHSVGYVQPKKNVHDCAMDYGEYFQDSGAEYLLEHWSGAQMWFVFRPATAAM